VRRHKARGVSPGIKGKGLAEPAERAKGVDYHIAISIEWAAIDKYELIQLSPTSWARHIIWSRSWGSRPRLYADARFAG
jgi:hypothetical protein